MTALLHDSTEGSTPPLTPNEFLGLAQGKVKNQPECERRLNGTSE